MCLPYAQEVPSEAAAGNVPLDDVIPCSLSEFLLASGIDTSRAEPYYISLESGRLAVLHTASPEQVLDLLQFPDGGGYLLAGGNIPAADGSGLLIRFDSTRNTFSTHQLPSGCIRQLSSTLKSLVSSIYNCAVETNALSCTLSIIDLFTDIYLISIECEFSGAAQSS